MDHGAIFIPASPPSSSGQPSPALSPMGPRRVGLNMPIRSLSGSIMIPASPFGSQPPSRKSTMFEPLTEMPTSVPLGPAPPPPSNSAASRQSQTSPHLETSRDLLIRLSHSFIEAINRRDWAAAEAFSDVVDHNCFRGQVTDFEEIDSYQVTLEIYKSIASRAPAVQIHILDTTCQVDETSGYANVYINVDAAGQSGGIATQGVSIFEWLRTRKYGQWLLVKHTSLKGVEGIV